MNNSLNKKKDMLVKIIYKIIRLLKKKKKG